MALEQQGHIPRDSLLILPVCGELYVRRHHEIDVDPIFAKLEHRRVVYLIEP